MRCFQRIVKVAQIFFLFSFSRGGGQQEKVREKKFQKELPKESVDYVMCYSVSHPIKKSFKSTNFIVF